METENEMSELERERVQLEENRKKRARAFEEELLELQRKYGVKLEVRHPEPYIAVSFEG